MHLEQLNLTYLHIEDRILLRIGFAERSQECDDDTELKKKEIQIFFTRRLLMLMWPTLLEVMSAQLRISRPEAAFASDELVNMQHQQAVDKIKEEGNFDQDYESDGRESVTGDAPLLIETVRFHLKSKNHLTIEFIPVNGGAIEMKLDDHLLHGLCKLIIDAEHAAGWGLELSLPKLEEMSVPKHLLN